MGDTGTVTQDADGTVQWKIKGFTSLIRNEWYSSRNFSCAEGKWHLWIRRVCPEGGRSGQRIELQLCRWINVGPCTLDVEYTFSVQSRDGHRHGESRNRREFGTYDSSPWIGIDLEEERMSDLVPGDTLTVLCRLERIHPTRGVSARSNCSYCGGHFDAGSISSHRGKCLDKPIRCPECSEVVVLRNWYDHQCHGRSSAQEAARLKEELRQKTGELASVRRELAESQSELVRLRRLNEELNLKVTDLEADRDNAQKLLQTKSEDCTSGSSSLLDGNKLMRDFRELFLGKEECDVVLRVQGKEFPAHKLILMARSPVLASALTTDMKERATGVIEIEDCDPSSFSDFLCYIYCGAVENLSSENVFDLFTSADKYDVRDLRSECLEFLKRNLSVDTFCNTMTLALRHSETELIDLATDFFTQNAPQIIVTVKWQQFLIDYPTQSNELFIKFATSSARSNK